MTVPDESSMKYNQEKHVVDFSKLFRRLACDGDTSTFSKDFLMIELTKNVFVNPRHIIKVSISSNSVLVTMVDDRIETIKFKTAIESEAFLTSLVRDINSHPH